MFFGFSEIDERKKSFRTSKADACDNNKLRVIEVFFIQLVFARTFGHVGPIFLRLCFFKLPGLA